MTPQDFDSFVMGVDLTAANYSGGAGGTFTDLVQGAGTWTVESSTPTFETRNGIEGMDFTGIAGDAVKADMLALHEATIVAIVEGDTGTQVAFVGGTYTIGNSWCLLSNANTLFAFAPPATSAISAADANLSTRASVVAASWSPSTGTIYSQINDGAVTSSVTTGANAKAARINWHEVAIGQHRTSYLNGWVARVLIFSRALHARDNDNLQALIATEMASVGL